MKKQRYSFKEKHPDELGVEKVNPFFASSGNLFVRCLNGCRSCTFEVRDDKFYCATCGHPHNSEIMEDFYWEEAN